MNDMKQGIVIITHEKTKDFFEDCIKSLEGVKYPLLIHDNTVWNELELKLKAEQIVSQIIGE